MSCLSDSALERKPEGQASAEGPAPAPVPAPAPAPAPAPVEQAPPTAAVPTPREKRASRPPKKKFQKAGLYSDVYKTEE